MKRGLPGGINQADVNDPYIQEMASFAVGALDGINYPLISLYRKRIHRILEASQQVCSLLICIVAVVYCTVSQHSSFNPVHLIFGT